MDYRIVAWKNERDNVTEYYVLARDRVSVSVTETYYDRYSAERHVEIAKMNDALYVVLEQFTSHGYVYYGDFHKVIRETFGYELPRQDYSTDGRSTVEIYGCYLTYGWHEYNVEFEYFS